MKHVYAFAPGENHVPYILPVIKSILKSNPNSRPHFCILLPSTQRTIEINADCTFKIISPEDFATCKQIYFKEGRADIPPFATYSQLMLPRYFQEYKKILFLEVDQVVQKSLADFWDNAYRNDIKIGAVRSIDSKTGKPFDPPSDEFFDKQFEGKPYYNMGVVLFDTEYWTSEQLEQKCMAYAERQLDSGGKTYKFYAQGAMNCALHDAIIPLDQTYNLTGLGYNPDIPSQMLEDATILHWNGPQKPWQADGLYKEIYVNATSTNSANVLKLDFKQSLRKLMSKAWHRANRVLKGALHVIRSNA